MTWLLDGNILAALVIDSHEHHDRVCRWFNARKEPFSTCSVTQGTFLRLCMQMAADRSAATAWAALKTLEKHPEHVFWNEGFSYTDVPFKGLQGSRKVTDAWLAELARRKESKIATLDAPFAALYPDRVILIPF